MSHRWVHCGPLRLLKVYIVDRWPLMSCGMGCTLFFHDFLLVIPQTGVVLVYGQIKSLKETFCALLSRFSVVGEGVSCRTGVLCLWMWVVDLATTRICSNLTLLSLPQAPWQRSSSSSFQWALEHVIDADLERYIIYFSNGFDFWSSLCSVPGVGWGGGGDGGSSSNRIWVCSSAKKNVLGNGS